MGGPSLTYTLTAENSLPRTFHKWSVGTKFLSVGKKVDLFFIK